MKWWLWKQTPGIAVAGAAAVYGQWLHDGAGGSTIVHGDAYEDVWAWAFLGLAISIAVLMVVWPWRQPAWPVGPVAVVAVWGGYATWVLADAGWGRGRGIAAAHYAITILVAWHWTRGSYVRSSKE